MRNVEVNTTKMPDGTASFHPHARIVGDFVYVSGIIATKVGIEKIPGVIYDAAGGVIGHDVVEQFNSIIENLVHVLEEAGTSLENVIDVAVFLTDIDRDFKKFNQAYGKYFDQIKPARTTVEVSRFPSPVCIEMKVIAILN